MSAKIKTPSTHHRQNPRPRGVSHRAFEQVYWPFIPVIIAIGLLLPGALSTGSISRFIKHPSGQVLDYAISENPAMMLADTNAQRTANGEPPLQLNPELAAAATAKAKDMAARNYWSHDTPDGNPPWVFVTNTGYSYQKLGENLATGFINEAAAVKGWMASPPHRENLLDPLFTQVGFGFANSPDYKAVGGNPSTIFVAFYGRPSGTVPIVSSSPSSNSQTPSTPSANPILGDTTQVKQASTVKQLATWSPVALVLAVLVPLALLVGKHTVQIRRVIKRGERFVWRHPFFDLALVLLILLALGLWQTIGLVK